jgi:cytochrome bd-type quinol oxidase subunit 2
MVASTRPGRWALASSAAFVVLMAFFVVAVAAGQRGGDEFFDNLWLTIPILMAYAAAVAAFVLGVVAIATKRERSVSVVAVTVVGLFVTTYGVLEVAFPH